MILYLSGCIIRQSDSPKSFEQAEQTTLRSLDVLEQYVGSAYSNKARQFFLVTQGDTSRFRPVITMNKNGRISLYLNLPYQQPLAYDQVNEELQMILPLTNEHFSMDSLRSISIGRLAQTGDLAVAITSEYLSQEGVPGPITTSKYSEVEAFLLESSLTQDFNALLSPYSLQVVSIEIEKVFFVSQENFLKLSTVIESQKIPDQILDCIVWVKVELRD
ncbi:MAG: hypothetical protein KI790_15210 [Cyclobacteriaceae bacterium]|nr:hypothetical protein [Cyclobacteriaceae bacterium HetDA_MAG_MS6]